MAVQMLRLVEWAIATRTASASNPRRVATFKKALIPMLFMQETSRSMASSNPTSTGKTSISIPDRRQPAMLTKSLELRSHSKKDEPNKQVAVILGWMLAKNRHLHKYDAYYSKQGFDVLLVRLTPWQLLWPTKGTQLVALDILNFLEYRSQSYDNILVHGFSVGAYLYGEILIKMITNQAKYEDIMQKVIGQVFDSAVDYEGIPFGLAKAITQNKLLQNTLQAYISYHLRTFYDSATKHYLASSEQFHNNVIKVPSLFLFSKDDPVATPDGNMKVIRNWERRGIQVFTKCWDSSPHVSHFSRHPDEYLEELSAFLDRLGLLAEPHRRASKL